MMYRGYIFSLISFIIFLSRGKEGSPLLLLILQDSLALGDQASAEFILLSSIIISQSNMKRTFILFALSLFVLLTLINTNKGNYLDTVSYKIVPEFPSEAFLGQYYTCRFRVNGMSKPIFRFYNLPSFFSASPSGIIQGIPDKTGTFQIVVSYQQIYKEDQQTILLRVVSPYFNEQALELKKKKTRLVSFIEYDASHIYKIYEDVQINLNKNSKNKYYWTYLNLPDTLQATQDGFVTGIFNREGYYSFGAICTDQNGYSIDYFFNLNVQPFIFTGFRKQPTFADLYVQNTLPFNYRYIQEIYNEAYKNLKNTYQNANKTIHAVTSLKNKFLATRIAVKDAEVQFQRRKITVELANTEKTFKMVEQQQQRQNMTKYQNVFKLAQTAFTQAVNKLKDAKIQLDSAQAFFHKTQKIFNDTSKLAVQAENQLRTAVAEVQRIQKQMKGIKEDLDIYFEDISQAKKTLQSEKSKKIPIDLQASNARNKKAIAESTNDEATAKLNSAGAALQKQKKLLNEANSNINKVRLERNQNEVELGRYKFDLNQALNQLFVAQAAKEQVDKAMQIATAQASIMPSGNTTYIFGGCDCQNYPSISGTAQIIKNANQRTNVYQLDSGFSIVPGNCNDPSSPKPLLKEGDTIFFQGYVKNGLIHGTKVQNSQ